MRITGDEMRKKRLGGEIEVERELVIVILVNFI